MSPVTSMTFIVATSGSTEALAAIAVKRLRKASGAKNDSKPFHHRRRRGHVKE
jgi:hypothetical protein